MNWLTASGRASSLALAILLTLALPGPISWAATANTGTPPGMQHITSVEGISEYRLANGLRVLLFPDQSKQTITVNMTYLVGSRHENYGETGMAHLLEHMLFKGSTHHTNIPQELTEHGARPNGTTSEDRTNYFETFAATDENLRWALDLESDRMVNSFVARKDLDTEMTVVRNEFESGENSPSNVLMERIRSTAYLWHNYGNSPIGSRADVENVPIEKLQAFYRTYYQPDNAVLVLAGKFAEASTLALVNQFFSKIARPSRVLPALYTVEPAQDGEREVSLRRVGDAQYAALVYHIPAGSHADLAALNLLNIILSDEPSGRLYKALVETKQAAGIFGFPMQAHDPGVIYFGAQVRKESSLETARDTLIATVESLAAHPPTAEELERARTQALKQIDLQLNNSDRVGLSLSNWIAIGDWRLFFLYRDRLREVKLDDVNRVAKAYLTSTNRTTGLCYTTATTERTDIPPRPDVEALVKNYKGDAARSEGEAFDPSPANIDARTQRSTLPGGLQLALLPKKTRGGSVNGSLTLRFGDVGSLAGQRYAASYASAMLMRGTTQHTRQQLQDEFDRLKARVNVGGGGGTVSVGIETIRENLPAVLTLVAEVLRHPAFPANEFASLQQERLAQIEEQSKEPAVLGSTALNRHLSPYPADDIRYVPTVDESMAANMSVSLDDAKRFYAAFYGARVGELALVGDFDPKTVTSQVQKLFSGWSSQRQYARVPTEYRDVAAIDESIATPDKANAFLMAAMNLPVRDDDADYPALVLGNYMLGGGFLNSRLATRLRQKEGLSYGVGSQFNASALDRSGGFLAYAIYAPQNADRLLTAMREELQRAITDGFTAEEIATAKSGWLQSRQVSRAQDGELARSLANSLFLKRTLAWDASLEQRVSALTADDLNSALKRQLDFRKLSIVKAGDFAAAVKPGTGN